MPNMIEAQGVTVDEAIQIALNQLGVGRDSVEIKILHHPRTGFLGIGARRAKVRATLREDAFKDGAEFDMSAGDQRNRRRRRRPQRGQRAGQRGSERDDQEAAREQKPRTDGKREGEAQRTSGQREPEKDKDRGRERSRGGRRSGRGRGGRGRGESQSGPQAGPQSGPQAGLKGERSQGTPAGSSETKRPQQRGERGSGRRRGDEAAPTSREGGASPVPQRAAATPVMRPRVSEEASTADEQNAPRLPLADVKARSQEIVTDVLRLMGFEATVATVEDSAHDEVVVRVTADAEGLLIGRRGQTLDAIEHLVNRAVAPREAGESRVVLDVGGYRDRRRESLLELAARLRERALRERRRVQVSPMSPRDRKIFQDAFESDDEVSARSLGTGFYRRVLIQPAGIEDGSSGPEANGEDEETKREEGSSGVVGAAEDSAD